LQFFYSTQTAAPGLGAAENISGILGARIDGQSPNGTVILSQGAHWRENPLRSRGIGERPNKQKRLIFDSGNEPFSQSGYRFALLASSVPSSFHGLQFYLLQKYSCSFENNRHGNL